MSRFYHALREASRSRQDAVGNVGWEALQINGSDAPPETPIADDPKPGRTAAALADDTPWELPSEERLPSSDVDVRTAVLGTSAKVTLDRKARVIPNAVDPAVVEHYRRLRTKLIQQQATKPFRSLMVTSANPQEGKTVTVLNLGLSFAMLPGFRVLVVDGDLRRGSLGKWLGAEDRPGLSNLIDGSAGLEDVVLKCDDIPFHFMLSGNSKQPPGELLQSGSLSGHLKRMTEMFHLVLVDSPPVNLITDAQLLAANCDAVLLIARAFSTTRKTFERAVQDLQPFNVVGTVLNGGTRAQLYRRYRGYY